MIKVYKLVLKEVNKKIKNNFVRGLCGIVTCLRNKGVISLDDYYDFFHDAQQTSGNYFRSCYWWSEDVAGMKLRKKFLQKRIKELKANTPVLGC